MGNERVAVRGLPPTLMEGLREAFAAEVAERLPRLIAALQGRDLTQMDAALRDAHTLGSSAVVLGERPAALSARRLEALIVTWREAPRAALLDDAAREVDRLQALLAHWSPAAVDAAPPRARS